MDLTFVVGTSDEPINAIKNGAITLQEAIQFMNISETDYVAASRMYRNFLQQNGFYLRSTDEIHMTFSSDVNCDGVVNILDVATVAMAFGSTEKDPKWNVMADIAEPYGSIDIYDLTVAAMEFGNSL